MVLFKRSTDSHRSKRRRVALGGDSLDPGSGDCKRPSLYYCNYCRKDISGTVRIKCAKCPDYDLCVECFSVGAETHPHKCNHPYRVMDNLAFPLIHPDWNADEEVLLLEAIETCGVGNWGGVGDHMGTKTKVQCYDHYMSVYMHSPFSPLPDLTSVMGKSRAELLALARVNMDWKKNTSAMGDPLRLVKQEPSISPARIKTEDIKDFAEGRSPSGPLVLRGVVDDDNLGSKDVKLETDKGEGNSSSLMSTAKKTAGIQARQNLEAQAAASLEEVQSNRSIGGKKPKPLADDSKAGVGTMEQTGYNAKRQEFDPDYDQEAELLIADMEFKDNDSETDRELKRRILRIYFNRLNERKRRRDFLIDRGLINLKKQATLDRKRTKEERDLYKRSRIFLRYHSNEEHEALLAGLNRERELRQRIEELQEMRAAGCRKFREGETYLLEKKKREAEVHTKEARESLSLPQVGKVTHRSTRYMKRENLEGEPSPSGNVRSSQKPRSSGHHSSGSTIYTSGKGGKKKGGAVSDLAGCPGAGPLPAMPIVAKSLS